MDLQQEEPTFVSDTDGESIANEDNNSSWDPTENEELSSKHTEMNLNGISPEGVEPPHLIVDENYRIPDNPVAELLWYYYNMGHTPFSKLQEMAKRKVIPKQLAKCNIPVCSACSYVKATKRKWRLVKWSQLISLSLQY